MTAPDALVWGKLQETTHKNIKNKNIKKKVRQYSATKSQCHIKSLHFHSTGSDHVHNIANSELF